MDFIYAKRPLLVKKIMTWLDFLIIKTNLKKIKIFNCADIVLR